MTESKDTIANDFLSIRVNQQWICVNLDVVIKLLPMVTLQQLPDANSCGILNYHGQAVMIYDLSILLNMPAISYGDEPSILLCNINNQQVGFMIHEASHILHFNIHEQQQPNLSKLPNFISGIIEKKQLRTWILDLHTLLDNELLTNNESHET
jgi:chemotaxis signal transduction protein